MSKIENVHAREIQAPVSLVGGILDTLGSPVDRVWASDIWLAEPVVLDRPLGVGADGGHGSIRYSVVEYEPGRRIVFRFSPGGGLSGSHGFEVEAAGPDQTRITHFLDAQTSLWMRPLVPILIGWHDAMVETAFDRVQLEATGSLQRRTPIPRWLRMANRAEIAIARALGKLPPRGEGAGTRLPVGYRLFRPAAVLVPAALAAIAGIHAAWALGWRWPGHDDDSLADLVVGAGAELPPDPLTWAVAGLLGVGAAAVAAAGSGRPGRLVQAAAWSVSAVLLLRGAAYVPIDLSGGLETDYSRLDLAIYSPLSLALGLGAAIVARGPRPEHDAEQTRPHHGRDPVAVTPH
jgi:hypothetical protein